jgi:uncharacterized protein YbjT (DUF2867 family)
MTSEHEPKQVLVVGATGSIGRLVVERLLEAGDTARGLIRNPAKAQRLFGAEVETVVGDVNDPPSIQAALDGIGAVVMTHGAPYGSGDYEAVDYGAVPALLEALDGRVVRVALMSSIGVTGAGGSSRELLNWKRRAERLLRASGLPHTIVRPGWFDAGTGKEEHIDLRQGDQVDYGPVRREHVAEVLVQALHTPEASGRTLEVFSANGNPTEDWGAAFGSLKADRADDLDGAHDPHNLPLDREPKRVRSDAARWQGRYSEV